MSGFNPAPAIPPELENAAQSGELVVFVGAGISRLIIVRRGTALLIPFCSSSCQTGLIITTYRRLRPSGIRRNDYPSQKS